jgi:hypothetical protein
MNDNTEAWIIVALIVSLLAILLFSIVFIGEVTAEHPSGQTWPTGFKGPDGQSCCGSMDCIPANVFVKSQEEGDVEVNGEPMWIDPKRIFGVPPAVEVPEGFTGYFCKRNMAEPIEEGNARCLFFRSGNY